MGSVKLRAGVALWGTKSMSGRVRTGEETVREVGGGKWELGEAEENNHQKIDELTTGGGAAEKTSSLLAWQDRKRLELKSGS